MLTSKCLRTDTALWHKLTWYTYCKLLSKLYELKWPAFQWVQVNKGYKVKLETSRNNSLYLRNNSLEKVLPVDERRLRRRDQISIKRWQLPWTGHHLRHWLISGCHWVNNHIDDQTLIKSYVLSSSPKAHHEPGFKDNLVIDVELSTCLDNSPSMCVLRVQNRKAIKFRHYACYLCSPMHKEGNELCIIYSSTYGSVL